MTMNAASSSESPEGGAWITSDDGQRLHTWWRGPDPPRAVVWYVLGPEGGSAPPYPGLSHALVEAGMAVCFVHPRGTGRSPGRRGDIADLRRFIGDYRCFHHEIARRAPEAPVVLVGQSAGAAFAAEIGATSPRRIAAVVLVNPAYRLRATTGLTPTWRDYVVFAANLVWRPAAPVVDMNRRPLALEFAPDREEGLAMQRDPLVVRYFSLRMLRAQRRVMRRLPANVQALDVPVLLVEGAHDALVDPHGNDALLGLARTPGSAKLVVADGGHGSSAVETAVAPTVAWIEARVARPAA